MLPLAGILGNSGGSTSQPTTNTSTSSGANSPNAAQSSQAIGSGSIGLGSSSQYQEQGATSISAGGNVGGQVGTISAGTGSSVIIGDPNADNLISSLAQQFSSTVQNVAAGTSASAAAAPAASTTGTISYKTLGLIAAVIAAIVGLMAVFGGGKRS
jgi:hypothetical protein